MYSRNRLCKVFATRVHAFLSFADGSSKRPSSPVRRSIKDRLKATLGRPSVRDRLGLNAPTTVRSRLGLAGKRQEAVEGQ